MNKEIENIARKLCFRSGAWETCKECLEYHHATRCCYCEYAEEFISEGYRKIVWHDAKKELPECDKYVLGYYASDNTYAVVKWDCADWSDDNKVCYNVDYWAELPEFTHTDKIYEMEMTKSTAKNILNSLLDKLHEVTGCGTPYQVKKIIKEVAKEYDIEVDTAKYD